MAELVAIKESLFDAFKTFQEALLLIDHIKQMQDENILRLAEDGAIQRFEYCFDSFWKFCKRYLEEKCHVVDINSPRAVIVALVKHERAKVLEGELMLAMLSDRNRTTHTYDFVNTREIFNNLKKYYDVMVHIAEKLQ